MPTTHVQIDTPAGTQTMLLPAGENAPVISSLLRRQGLPLNTRCGERALCDGCLIDLVQGRLRQAVTGQTVTASANAPLQLRGCEYQLLDSPTPVQLRLPARSLLAHEPQVQSEFALQVPYAHDPLLPLQPDGKQTLGVAVDIGTTTVAVMLIDLATGQIVGRASSFNRQMHLGDDVVTRINLCMNNPDQLRQLQSEVVQHTLQPLVTQALRELGHDAADKVHLAGFTLAGNTTMLHLLAGVDPSSLGVAPFTPVFLEHRTLTADEVGLHLPYPATSNHPTTDTTPLHLLPGAAAYIGADLVAGLLSSGLAYDDGPSLLVDVGTNGEILFKHKDRILGCATAAGPAFEGARLHSGIRAGRGAISDITLNANPFAIHTQIIGNDRPIGLCGSAYIDFLAHARRIHLINESGRFDLDAVPDAKEHLKFHDDHASALVIAHGRGQQDLLITETDLASLLQAKAAIAAGIATLLEQAGVKPEEVKTLYLAGGFGTHMDHRNAIACGLLPGFAAEQVKVIGNSSLAGAMLAMLDRGALAEMSRLAKCIEIIELNLVPGFEDRFIDHLMLP